MEKRELLSSAHLEFEAVEAWMEAGWIAPREGTEAPLSEIDIARAQFIRDLTQDLGVNDEAIPIILHLVDQLYGLRRAMRELIERHRP
jgi:chaperone modulatory protein CbpM